MNIDRNERPCQHSTAMASDRSFASRYCLSRYIHTYLCTVQRTVPVVVYSVQLSSEANGVRSHKVGPGLIALHEVDPPQGRRILEKGEKHQLFTDPVWLMSQYRSKM